MVTVGCESGGLPLKTRKNAGKGGRRPQMMPLLISAELKWLDLSAVYTQHMNSKSCTGNKRARVNWNIKPSLYDVSRLESLCKADHAC